MRANDAILRIYGFRERKGSELGFQSSLLYSTVVLKEREVQFWGVSFVSIGLKLKCPSEISWSPGPFFFFFLIFVVRVVANMHRGTRVARCCVADYEWIGFPKEQCFSVMCTNEVTELTRGCL